MTIQETMTRAKPAIDTPRPTIADTLIANGYRPVPCTGKRPTHKGWPDRDFTGQDFGSNSNVGIKTGDGLALVDIDITDPDIAAAVVAEWERRHKGAMRRTGMAPKTAFLVACDIQAKREVKLADPKQKVEILAKGQQFIAYGIHPDTGKPYHWHDIDPLDNFIGPAEMLLPVSEAELSDFLAWVAREHGPKGEVIPLSRRAAAPRPAAASATGLDEVAEVLNHVSPDVGYGDWINVLMALHEHTHGSGKGLALADEWSARGAKYKPGDVLAKWKGFKMGGGVTIGTVYTLSGLSKPEIAAIKRKHDDRDTFNRFDDVSVGGEAKRPISKAAENLAKRIAWGIKNRLAELKEEPAVDALIVQDMIEGAFWSGATSKLFLLNEAECLAQFLVGDAWKFLCRRFGKPVDAEAIIEQWLSDAGEDAEITKKAKEDAHKAIAGETMNPIIDHLKYENQRDAVEWSVDMFGTRPRLELKEDVARIVLTHRPLDTRGTINPACIADYKAHFPLLGDTLEYVVASRFALDRKKSYLWMLASSDWGKNFFMGVLGDLGLVVEMSVKEIEGVFEGKASGKAPGDFKRAMILAVDEFKAVKSELKQLGSYIDLAPKYQLKSRVEIFTKLFLSAENVASLVGENGVEDQFANRMSMINATGSLDGRPVYEANKGAYFRSVKAFVAGELNRMIAEYQALGREGAERRADKYLKAFIGQHGLGQHFERLSDSYPAIAEQATGWIRNGSHGHFLSFEGGFDYVTSANKLFSEFLDEHYDKSEVGTLRRRKDEIMALMSEDGRGVGSHRIGGRTVKALKLKR